ncbi:DEAD/DEAH box helicase family protein [Nocardioides sp. Y6]|uniref:DEAD/DEAH box helicase family protein n=1 Tax=Nocardioides malaquae TaxID=2773426 RepID=A0ABR9RSM8_9ACTN|nr:DEAD/DEAH box helicase family protein [Nocardioides malaquae]MBE7324579.1 DEAD/DEAH box helicase family protein [Nocardioides malaquae]
MTTQPAPVEIQFDPDQEFQHDAIRAVVDLFRGQSMAPSQFEMSHDGAQGALISHVGFGNNVMVADEQVRANLDEVQDRNGIPAAFRGLANDAVSTLASWDFTVEMETGTGKTYVYLRTALELNKEYGFTKFVIVVPSVPIREGVEQNLRLLQSHFADLYDGLQYGVVKYDSKDLARLRGYANSNSMQFLIMNIDAFNKTDTNKIYDDTQDSMMGNRPIDFIRACNPIVIIDEPQNMESDTAKKAIAALNPAATLRYSATHRDRYQQVYRLTPVDAYRLGLVKRISVWSVTEELNGNKPYLKVLKVTAKKTTVTAQVEVSVLTDDGVKRKKVNVTGGRTPTDLRKVTDLDNYDGYVVEDINAEGGYIEFTNGTVVAVGDTEGASHDEVQRAQIRATIAEHLDRELEFHKRRNDPGFAPTKVLSLFFIDKVAHYAPDDGKFRRWFTEEYNAAKARPKYADLDLPAADKVHDGYFAVDKKGTVKDSRGSAATADDATAYELIMKDKQRLLSTDEPLRFIFSHSALREGWDNPNVFVICTLNDSKSEMRKRQEIGRGLRLPVDANGNRVTDPRVAKLTVVANEAYDEFAATLQHEIEAETGVKFDKTSIENARAKRVPVTRQPNTINSEAFNDLWARIQHRTTYQVTYSTSDLISNAAARLSRKPSLVGAKIRVVKSDVDITTDGVHADVVAEKSAITVQNSYPIPDLLGNLTRLVPVSRASIAQILIQCGRLGEVTTNPQQFIEQARDAIDQTLAELLVDGIKYEKRGTGTNSLYEMSLFLDEKEREELAARVYEVTNTNKAPYSHVVWDSTLEAEVAARLDAHEDVLVFLKLPRWFLIDTPVGPYNPDWAYIKQDEDGHQRLYLVRETKPTQDTSELRKKEHLKVEFGYAHFAALDDVNFGVIDSADQIAEGS